MIRKALLFVAALAAAPLASNAGAQVRLPTQPPIRQLKGSSKALEDTQPVPPAYRPPPGMCRIWLDNVPPSQQPAPTDCVSAVRNRPSNGRVLFGDDYVDRRGKGKEKRPENRVDVGPTRFAEPAEALDLPARIGHVAAGRVHGPQADDGIDAPMDARRDLPSGVAAFEPQPPQPRSAHPTPHARPVSDTVGRRHDWRDSVARGRDSTLSERRRALRDRHARDRDDDDDLDDDTVDARRADGRDAGAARGYGYYPPYPPPARANGVCLDRDHDGWCDDVRSGSQYCVDRDGDGRCDDYGDLAAAPYASAMPPMRAATDVQRGNGSAIALRWLGTAEVMVRTSDLKRTGVPYRAMWLDANTGRILQVWTDRDGDGVADRVEIYRNGRVAKILGR
jgi:hypothetical protein